MKVFGVQVRIGDRSNLELDGALKYPERHCPQETTFSQDGFRSSRHPIPWEYRQNVAKGTLPGPSLFLYISILIFDSDDPPLNAFLLVVPPCSWRIRRNPSPHEL